MDKELKNQLERYREAAMLFWHIAGDNENAEDLGTRSYENLLHECVLMATVMIKSNIKDWEYQNRREKNEQN